MIEAAKFMSVALVTSLLTVACQSDPFIQSTEVSRKQESTPDAFVAAWLPGSEGAGIADVLIADTNGTSRFDFTGRLSFSWPANAAQVQVNVGDEHYRPLFPYGYGLSYGDDGFHQDNLAKKMIR